MDKLPEFRVTLERLPDGEAAFSHEDFTDYYGRRTKLGGQPDYMQAWYEDRPPCPKCGKDTTFVAQIDSVEHNCPSNPHAVEDRKQRQWMLGDVGMIYVFFCFDCLKPVSYFECG